jgi:hypothetical protein
MKKIHLLFAVHNHQPVGNLDQVLQESWEKCYHPFLRILEKHPRFRITLHYSGALLERLEEEHPESLSLLAGLVERGQVELLSGGFYEPLLPMIPAKDAVGQILMLNRYLQEKLKATPRGFWLAERVWNPALPQILAPTGLAYTIVDDSHFRHAGIPEEEMFGHYVTEKEGVPLSIFPIHKPMRYAIPFRAPEETIEALRFYATDGGNLAISYADDGEKFGLWPGTHHWVYQEGWLEKFITTLEKNQDWIHLLTFGEYLEKFPPQGRVYLPAASYDEMMEWALPALSAIAYEDMVEELKKEGRYEKYKPFLRGACWENFLVKYPESNHMHKRMLYVSGQVHGMLEPERAKEMNPLRPAPALRALWKAQDHSAYWHGLFGGLYLNHLRHAVYRNLIAAECLAEEITGGKIPFLRSTIFDLDKDLEPEILISSPQIGAVLKPNYGGALVELGYRPKRFNLTNVLTRRPEAYHRKVSKSPWRQAEPTGQPRPIAESLPPGEKEREETLVYDWFNRYSFLDHFLGEATTFDQFRRCQYPELGNFVNQPYQRGVVEEGDDSRSLRICLRRSGGLWKKEGMIPIDLSKTFRFFRDGARLEVEYEIINRGAGGTDFWFGADLNLTYLPAQPPKRTLFLPEGERRDGRGTHSGVFSRVEETVFRDEAEGFELSCRSTPAGDLWRFPLETVSQSESGFERIDQGMALFFHWKFTLDPEEKKSLALSLSCREI